MAAAAATGLFAGMEFAISVRNEEGKHAKEMIEANGGTAVHTISHSPKQIVLMERVRLHARAPNQLAIEYIKDCLAAGQLLHREPYMLTADWSETPPSQQRRGPSHGGRRQYTNIERGAMLIFARNRKRDINQKLPRAFWELAARDKVTPHSAESMHEHYRKQLLHKTPAEKEELIKTYLEHLVASNQSREPASPSIPNSRPAAFPLFRAPPAHNAPLLPAMFPSTPVPSAAPAPTDVVDLATPSSTQSDEAEKPRNPDTPEPEEVPSPQPPAKRPRPTPPVEPVAAPARANQPTQRAAPAQPTPAKSPAVPAAVATPPPTPPAAARPSSSRELATDEQVDRMTELLATTTGMPRPVVTHALYCCSGNPRSAIKYLRGQLPLDCWTEEEDEWIRTQFGVLPKTWSPDLVKTTIRQVIHTHGGTTRPHTVQMVWQRLEFLTRE